MREEGWDDEEELITYFLILIHQLQGFIRSEGYTQADFELYVSKIPTPTIH